eukprot:Sdes_comp21331_c0_seq1m19971
MLKRLLNVFIKYQQNNNNNDYAKIFSLFIHSLTVKRSIFQNQKNQKKIKKKKNRKKAESLSSLNQIGNHTKSGEGGEGERICFKKHSFPYHRVLPIHFVLSQKS